MSDKHDFTQGSIPKKLLQFMLPVLGATILQAMYGAVDMLIVGRFGTIAGISGVSTGSNIITMITLVINALCVGITVLIGHYLGQAKNNLIGRVIGGAIYFFCIVAVLLTIVLLLLAEPVAVLLEAPPAALEQTTQYIRICGGGIIFVIAYNVISSIFRGLGDSRLPLIFVAIACAANVIGDLLLVAGLHMDAAGAALATIFAQAVSVAISLIIIGRQRLPFTMTRRDICFSGELTRFLRLGAPMACMEFITNGSFVILCAFVNMLGLEASSGYGVAQKLVSFIMLVPSSIMLSMSSFIAQNVGAGLEERAKTAMKTGMAFGAFVGIFISYTVFFHGDMVSAVFSSDAPVIMRSAEYLKGFAPEAVVTSILFSFYGYFNGHSRSKIVMLLGVLQSLVVRLPMSYYMSSKPDASLTDVALAAPTATIFGIIIAVYCYRLMQKTMQRSTQSRI